MEPSCDSAEQPLPDGPSGDDGSVSRDAVEDNTHVMPEAGYAGCASIKCVGRIGGGWAGGS